MEAKQTHKTGTPQVCRKFCSKTTTTGWLNPPQKVKQCSLSRHRKVSSTTFYLAAVPSPQTCHLLSPPSKSPGIHRNFSIQSWQHYYKSLGTRYKFCHPGEKQVAVVLLKFRACGSDLTTAQLFKKTDYFSYTVHQKSYCCSPQISFLLAPT